MGQIETREALTADKINKLQGKLGNARDLLDGKACVYATGSFGRLESGDESDLDLFILALDRLGADGKADGSRLSGLDAICIKADLIIATNEMGIPRFDGDGKYLAEYTVSKFVKTLGTPEDDVTNTFTARLLMLLESRPLLGGSVYDVALKEVLAAYFQDYTDHRDSFMPAFLSNDILRLWRTFCVNYEARTQNTPDEKKRKRKLKNYKLKHSRLLTCYSSLLYLLAVYNRNRTVAPGDVVSMVGLTPLSRLKWIAEQSEYASAANSLRELVSQYENFLISIVDEKALADNLMDKDARVPYLRSADIFGHTMFQAINAVGGESSFHRMLVV